MELTSQLQRVQSESSYQRSQIEQLQSMVKDLETQVAEKDRTIQMLQDQVQLNCLCVLCKIKKKKKKESASTQCGGNLCILSCSHCLV